MPQRTLTNAIPVDATAVIPNRQQELPSFQARPKREDRLPLTGRPTLRGPFEPVIHRISDQVHQGSEQRRGALAVDEQSAVE